MRFHYDSLAIVNYVTHQVVDLEHVAVDMRAVMGVASSLGWDLHSDTEEVEITTMGLLRDQSAFSKGSQFSVYKSDGMGSVSWKGGKRRRAVCDEESDDVSTCSGGGECESNTDQSAEEGFDEDEDEADEDSEDEEDGDEDEDEDDADEDDEATGTLTKKRR
jgi:hypothetical protein